jgi:cyclase
MLQGAGGNIGASIGEDGIVIVDDQYAPLAEKIQAALKSVTDKPIRFIINTHYHEDHVGGNESFRSRRRLSRMTTFASDSRSAARRAISAH